MHPARYYLAQHHLAFLRHRAQRAALARARRRALPHRAGHPVPAHNPAQTPRTGSAVALRDITRFLPASARRALRRTGVVHRNSGGSR
jgi:hypothetical protein